MLSVNNQANNIWAIYNQQEVYNKSLVNWRVFVLRYFRYNLKKYKRNVQRYNDIEFQQEKFLNDLKHALYNNNLEMKEFLSKHLIDTYKKMWKQANKNIKRNIPLPSDDIIEHIVKEIWVSNKNFEQRQNVNTRKILKKLNKIFKDSDLSIEQKQSEMEKVLTSYYNMNHRLFRTETVHIIGRSNLECLHLAGFHEVMWITAEDEKVCPVCNSRDNHIYSIELIPMYPDHPNCRCVLVGVKSNDNFNKTVITDHVNNDKIELENKDIAAINKYISSESYKINYKLREKEHLDKQDIEFINDLDTALDKLPKYNGNLCRAVDLSIEALDVFLNEHKEGNNVKYPAYTSMSTKDSYNDNATVMIYIENAKNGIDLRSYNGHESEVLYNRNSQFKVNTVYEEANKYYILLEEK